MSGYCSGSLSLNNIINNLYELRKVEYGRIRRIIILGKQHERANDIGRNRFRKQKLFAELFAEENKRLICG